MTTPYQDPPGHEEIDWPKLYKRLTVYAYHRLEDDCPGRKQLAQDLAAEAISRVFDARYTSTDDPATPLALQLGSVINGLLANRRRSSQLALEHPDPQIERHAAPDETTTPEEEFIAQRGHQRLLDALMARIQEDTFLVQLVRCWLELDLERPQEIAAALQCSIQEVYNANRRLKTHCSALKASLGSPAQDGPDAREDSPPTRSSSWGPKLPRF